MGYFIKEKKVAKVGVEPAKVSLGNNPNFIEFEAEQKKSSGTYFEIYIEVLNGGYFSENSSPVNFSSFKLTELKTGRVFDMRGSHIMSEVGGDVFYLPLGFGILAKDVAAIHLFNFFLTHDFFQGRFDIRHYIEPDPAGTLNHKEMIHIKAKGVGDDYSFTIETDGYRGMFFISTDDNHDEVQNPDDLFFDTPEKCELTVMGNGINSEGKNVTKFTISETNTGTKHVFRGTTDPKELNDNTFYLGSAGADGNPSWSYPQIANSLKECLLKNRYLKSNFDISLPFQLDAGGDLVMGTTIKIVSKGYGEMYNFSFEAEDDDLYRYFLETPRFLSKSSSSDAISEGYNNVEIQLDVYKDTGLFPGESGAKIIDSGSYVTTLSKAYLSAPVWFDLNALKAEKYSDAFLRASGWCDAGTVQDYRFVAKRLIADERYYTNDVFYLSDVLYNVTGYGRTLEDNDLSDYVYDANEDNPIKPLTRQPELTHILGQKQYFNFILSDSYHNHATSSPYMMGIRYELFTQSGTPIRRLVQQEEPGKMLNIVNTICLDIDNLLQQYPNTGVVKVCLTRDGRVVSTPLVYNILPAHLYAVRDYAFLNSLGGWSSFNFSESSATDFKSASSTYNRNCLPRFKTGDVIEGVHYKSAEESFTVQTMAVRHEVADWLKEMSVSPAVYELSTGRYIVVDELNVKHSTQDNLVRVDMKYHYSDSYNSEMAS